MVRVRFAPSPTGPLHVGGARTALFNYLVARKAGGSFILRIDDTDEERSEAAFEADIVSSLSWLGIDWDEGPDVGGAYAPYRQSQRREKHLECVRLLIEKGKAYKDSGDAVRLKYPYSEVVVKDIVCGECKFSPQSLGPEPVLLRSDGNPTYHLASVSDDIEMGITHIIRGQDHLTNTAKHQLIFEGLGVQVPQFAHLPLILGADGTKLSKRNSEGLSAVSDFRAEGYLPEALVNFLMQLGWSHPESEDFLTLAEGITSFTLERVKQTASIFDLARLNFLNSHWVRQIPAAELAERGLDFIGDYRELVSQRGIGFWQTAVAALQGELTTLKDVEGLAKLLFDLEVSPGPGAVERFGNDAGKMELKEVVGTWRELLKEVPLLPERDSYNVEQFSQISAQLKKRLGAPPLNLPLKTVFQGLRVAVTGEVSGPELKVLVPFIPRDLLISRADGVLEKFR